MPENSTINECHQLNSIRGWLAFFVFANILGAIQTLGLCSSSSDSATTITLVIAVALQVSFLILLFKRNRAFKSCFYAFWAWDALLLLVSISLGYPVDGVTLISYLPKILWLIYIIKSKRVKAVLGETLPTGYGERFDLSPEPEQTIETAADMPIKEPNNVPAETSRHHFESNRPNSIECLSQDRYCKYCGSSIDPETKMCTGCGKQYFRLPKVNHQKLWNITSVILIVCLVCLWLYNWQTCDYNYNRLQILSGTIDRYEKIVSDKDFTISRLTNNYDNAERRYLSELNKNSELSQKVDFFDRNVVFVTTTGSRYHHIDCQYMKEARYYAYNIELAKAKGYTPCQVCWKD